MAAVWTLNFFKLFISQCGVFHLWPQIGARLVLEHDRHVAPSIQMTTSDVDDGSTRDWTSAGL